MKTSKDPIFIILEDPWKMEKQHLLGYIMTKPRFLLELYGSNFKSEIVCRGSQLTLILNEIKAFPLKCVCYMGDIDANFTPPFLKKFSGWKVKK